MSVLSDFQHRAFAALSVRNFRLYVVGHFISVSGLWMQRIAQSWLVLELTGSGAAMGAVTALQFAPIWFIAPLGGLLADRFDRRRLLLVTQSSAATIALAMGVLVITGLVELWMIYAMALALGIVGSVDNPTRQSLIPLLVGRDRITNAVGLNTVLVTVSRVLGPALAGALIVSVGIGICFIIDAASYLAMIIALVLIRVDPVPGEASGPSNQDNDVGFSSAIGEARRNFNIGVPLFMVAGVSAFTYQFEITLPLMARFAFGGDADTFGAMFAVMGAGAAIGGLAIASRRGAPRNTLPNLAAATAGAMLVVALAPSLPLELAALFIVGALVTALLVQANSTLQMSAPPRLMGRVMALHALALLGMRPIFSPGLGWVGDHFGPRWPLIIGAAAALLVSLAGRRMLVRAGPSQLDSSS